MFSSNRNTTLQKYSFFRLSCSRQLLFTLCHPQHPAIPPPMVHVPFSKPKIFPMLHLAADRRSSLSSKMMMAIHSSRHLRLLYHHRHLLVGDHNFPHPTNLSINVVSSFVLVSHQQLHLSHYQHPPNYQLRSFDKNTSQNSVKPIDYFLFSAATTVNVVVSFPCKKAAMSCCTINKVNRLRHTKARVD